MKNELGNPITMITQVKALYSVPNHGQIPKEFYEQTFYEYRLLSPNYTDQLSPLTFDPVQAREFARQNELEMISSVDRLMRNRAPRENDIFRTDRV